MLSQIVLERLRPDALCCLGVVVDLEKLFPFPTLEPMCSLWTGLGFEKAVSNFKPQSFGTTHLSLVIVFV